MTEAQLNKAVVKRLSELGCYAVKIVGGPRQQAGLLDIVGCNPDGEFFAIEGKKPGVRRGLTALQAKTIEKIEAVGGRTGVYTTVKEARKLVGV